MSVEVTKTGTSSELDKFKAGITNTEPALMGTGKVSELGLFYVKKGDVSGTVWQSNVGDLDGFQIKLNREKVTNINRAYRFDITAGGKIPFKSLTLNTMSMRMKGWQVPPLRIGDEVELYAWRNGAFVQYAFKKKE